MRRAVIDIGTNSVKLLIAEAGPSGWEPVEETGEQTRLGAGFYESHRLQPAGLERTAEVVARLARRALELGVELPRVIATSVARDARNPERLEKVVRQSCGLRLEVISGAQEAEWVYQGVGSDPRLSNQNLVIIDAGGGSTEIVVGRQHHAGFRCSIQLGTVRLFERGRFSDPPTDGQWEACRSEITAGFDAEICAAVERARSENGGSSLEAVGASGTATILAKMQLGTDSYDRTRLDGLRLSLAQLTRWRTHLWGCPLEERRMIPGLPPERADVMLVGVAIYELALEVFRLPELYISTRSLRFGALLK
jgi:exopolyphosphatase/guanosine-5'-triphosphate,3'-diphosphate pyrophosphatase